MIQISYPTAVDYSPFDRAAERIDERAKERNQWKRDLGDLAVKAGNGIASQINNYAQKQKMDAANAKQDKLMEAYYNNIINDPNSTPQEKNYAMNILNTYYTKSSGTADTDEEE